MPTRRGGVPVVTSGAPRTGLMIMPTRLMARCGGPDILVDRALVLVGRHPGCDVRLESFRVSRIHCCLSRDRDEILVRDLASTNGIRINDRRAEAGRLREGDELSIAHLRYRLELSREPEFAALSPSAGDPEYGPSPRPGAEARRVEPQIHPNGE
jgi:predicted component of type VI protein secretion system